MKVASRVLGASLGGTVALQVLTASETPIKAVALVNPAVRIRSAVGLVDDLAGHAYRWTAQARQTADELDFVARVADLTTQPPLLLVGEILTPWFIRQLTNSGVGEDRGR